LRPPGIALCVWPTFPPCGKRL